MHELLLFGQVPASRHDQMLKILAGIAGMQPNRVIERHLIFKPRRAPSSKAYQVGGSQGIQNQQTQTLQGQLQGELFYLRLVTDVDGALLSANKASRPSLADKQDELMPDADVPGTYESKEPDKDVSRSLEGLPAAPRQSYSLRFYDLPEVTGRRPVTSRMISSVEITEGDPMGFMDAFGYDYTTDYVLEGRQVVHENVIILLHRILRFQSESALETLTLNESERGKGRMRDPEDYKHLSPVDPSGGYLLQASIRVKDGSKPESMTLGINELKRLKDTMKGVVDLEIGDRLALDTRVR